MEIRYTLDPQLDAKLIGEILERANGGSVNRAAYLLAVENSAINSAVISTPQRQNSTPQRQIPGKTEDNKTELAEALASIDDIFG